MSISNIIVYNLNPKNSYLFNCYKVCFMSRENSRHFISRATASRSWICHESAEKNAVTLFISSQSSAVWNTVKISPHTDNSGNDIISYQMG